jgi:peptidoglycan/xylan/chitin deacetylase (PgdA/CDA1 family)
VTVPGGHDAAMTVPHRFRPWRVAAILLAVFALSLPAPPAHAARSAAIAPPVWLAGVDGGVFALGSAPFHGSLGGRQLNQPVIAVAGTRSGGGYWLAALDGGVFAFGDAHFYGSLGATYLNQPIVDMAATPKGAGYWLVAADGGVFTFGDAHFYGSLGATHLNQPITGLVPTPSGRGYWLVAADGGVFTFGDAHFYGSLGASGATPAIAAIAATPNGNGYWLLRRDGRVFHFGNAATLPDATGAHVLADGLVPTRSGAGYWIAFADGTVRAFGDAAQVGLAPIHLAASVVGMATPWASSSGFALPLLEFLRTVANTQAPRQTWVGPHEVALTFDDGPSGYTLSVLAALERDNVPATFFTVGYLAAARPDLLVAEASAGMSVEVHDWDHADLTRLSIPAITVELTRSVEVVQAATGRRPTCFRPPYGSTNSTVAGVGTKLGLTQILWNVDPSDYLRPGANVIASRVLAAATGRGLVVGIHDGGGDRSQTIAALPAIVQGLRARDYTFVRLCA